MTFLAQLASLFALVSFGSSALAQAVYRCSGPEGRTVFQQAPCEGGARVAVRESNVIESQASVNPGLLEGAQRRSLVENGRLFEGMSAAEARQVLGAPTRVNRSAGRWGTLERWVYRYPDGSIRYAYLRDGRLDTVSSHESVRQPTRRERGDCPSALQIRNASVGLSSATLSPEERARRAAEHRRMVDCR